MFGTHRLLVVVVILLKSFTNKSLTTIGVKAVGFEASGGSTTGSGGPEATVEFGAKADGVLSRLCLGNRRCIC